MTEIYVHESGTAGSEAIIFLHGVGVSGNMWTDHMERLSNGEYSSWRTSGTDGRQC
jgi:hypothetical protein